VLDAWMQTVIAVGKTILIEIGPVLAHTIFWTAIITGSILGSVQIAAMMVMKN